MDTGVHRYTLTRVKGGYELENKVTGETFEAVCRELLISKIYKRHDAKKVHRRKYSVIFNSKSLH